MPEFCTMLPKRSVVLEAITPYKSIRYLKRYFENVDHIYQQDSEFRQLRKQFLLGYLILSVVSLQWTWYYLVNHDPMQCVILFDVIAIYHLEPLVRLIIPGFMLLALYYMEQFYFRFEPDVILLARKLIVDQDDSFFLLPHLYKGRPASQYTRMLALVLTNLFQCFVVVIDLSKLWNQLYTWHYFYQNAPDYFANWQLSQWILLPVALGYLELNCIIETISWYLFAHIMILLCVIVAVVLRAYILKLEQLCSSLKQLSNLSTRWQQAKLKEWLCESRRFTVTILTTNRLFGKTFFAFLLVNCPSNCLLVLLVLHKSYTPLARVVLGFVCIQQWICIFGIHFIYVTVNRRLAKPNKPLVFLAGRKRFRGRLNRSLAFYVEAFHCRRKKYGFTYYCFGLISMTSFVEYMMLYIEFLLYVYKFVR